MNWPALGGLILTCVIIFFVAKKISSEPEERAIQNEELRRAVMMDTLLRWGLLEEMIQPGDVRVIDKIRRMLKL